LKTNRRYHYFEQFCLRTPIFPFSFYSYLTEGEEVLTHQFQKVWDNKILQEAIYLASPSLFEETQKWLKYPIEQAKAEKLSYSLLKYCSRMATRCTPFGLFAGCTMGSLSDKTAIMLADISQYSRQTRFDMNFLVSLGFKLASNPIIRKQLLFYPNTSLYKVGGQLRYIEYVYVKTQRIHSIEAIHPTNYLLKVLEASKAGKSIAELALLLVDTETSLNEAIDYIEELVANQVLVSELEASVSGSDFLGELIAKLQQLQDTTKIVEDLQGLSAQLKNIDKQVGNSIDQYKQLITNLQDYGYSFDKKYLFQADLFTNAKHNRLSLDIIQSIRKGMIMLNKLTISQEEKSLDQFRKAFVKRYEGQEVPLALALDTEMGIGYIQNQGIADDNPLIDDLILLNTTKVNRHFNWDTTQALLHEKLVDALSKNAYSLDIDDKDLVDFPENWDDLPDTLSMLAEVLIVNGEERIYFNGVGGSSAANLLGRFCHGDKELLAHAQNIVGQETQLQKDKIRAEIVHLPQSRTGNILIRPVLRSYEIPYLAKSTLTLDHQLPLSDLML